MDKIRRISVFTLFAAVGLLVSGACSAPTSPNKTDQPKTEPDEGDTTAYLMPATDSPDRAPVDLVFVESRPFA